MSKKITMPLTEKTIESLKAGDEVLLSGVIYTARDQAHKRMCEMLDKGESLPVPLAGEVLYYCGPAPRGKRIIGSCGPTTSGRMDPFTEPLLENGLKGMIGKGRRSSGVAGSIRRNKAVYFVTAGGAGAYLSAKVVSCECVAFEDLAAEAIYKLKIEEFPAIVAIDSKGDNIYDKY
ncbi:MAG: TRZ/ATZ family protein [Candidatus Omnitrophica bacterium]|nr:TRZ/ATZ family protein [Candidatus Omnitrophota bacterium]